MPPRRGPAPQPSCDICGAKGKLLACLQCHVDRYNTRRPASLPSAPPGARKVCGPCQTNLLLTCLAHTVQRNGITATEILAQPGERRDALTRCVRACCSEHDPFPPTPRLVDASGQPRNEAAVRVANASPPIVHTPPVIDASKRPSGKAHKREPQSEISTLEAERLGRLVHDADVVLRRGGMPATVQQLAALVSRKEVETTHPMLQLMCLAIHNMRRDDPRAFDFRGQGCDSLLKLLAAASCTDSVQQAFNLLRGRPATPEDTSVFDHVGLGFALPRPSVRM